MSQQPAAYNAGVGYPVNQFIDGNLTVVDPSGIGLYGTVTAQQFIGQFVGPLVGLVPSGDPSGATDLANIQGLINLGSQVQLGAATYVINNPIQAVNGMVLKGISNGGFGHAAGPTQTQIFLAKGSNCSMLLCPIVEPSFYVADIFFNANGANQTGPVQTSASGAAIHVVDAPSTGQQYSLIERCLIQSAYSDGVYLGNNRAQVKLIKCVVNNSGLGGTALAYGFGNGINNNSPDAVFDSCDVGTSWHHGLLQNGGRGDCRVYAGDYFAHGQDWKTITPVSVASSSNGANVATLSTINVTSSPIAAGFQPGGGMIFVNTTTGPTVFTYTGLTSSSFTGCALYTNGGVTSGALATSQTIYTFGGSGIYVTSSSGIGISGRNSLDKSNGCGVYVESGPGGVMIHGNNFTSNGQAANGLLPQIMLVSPGNQATITGNTMGPQLNVGFPNKCTYMIYATDNTGWQDSANCFQASLLTSGLYSNVSP